jgi:hypothetical protein
MRAWVRSSIAIFFFLTEGFLPLCAQGQPDLLIFDENSPPGTAYYDASFGTVSAPSQLLLATAEGSSTPEKLSIDNLHHFTGIQSGLLTWLSAAGGNWSLFVASPGWAARDASTYDSLLLYLNGPAALLPSVLPRLGLESSSNAKTATLDLGSFLPGGIDADTLSWQRLCIPLAAFQPTGGFSLSQFKDFWFSQGNADGLGHTLWFDNVRIISRAGSGPLTAPQGIVIRAGDRSVILHWDPNPQTDLGGYNVYRSAASSGPFNKLTAAPVLSLGYADLTGANGSTYWYVVRAVNSSATEGPPSDTVGAVVEPFADDSAFVDYVESAASDYFWYEANPSNGLIRDRSTSSSPASIAAVGFGLTAICNGVDRGWITRAAARDRVLTTLRTFWEGPQGPSASGMIGYRGFFYHFLDMNTGVRVWNCELSSIDTGLLIAGIIDARQYFSGPDSAEVALRALADSIYRRVDWDWMRNGGQSLAMGWTPEAGFLSSRWIGYNEGMILYLLAIGAEAHAIPASAWGAWTAGYSWQTHYGYSYVAFPPLFGHQYSHCWIDFRNIVDAYMLSRGITYFENSRRATLAQREYCVANPGGYPEYGTSLWGLTACDGPGVAPYLGYAARGAPPGQNDDGTIAPTAAGGSIVFAPEACLPVLRGLYDQYRGSLWTPYGFSDAFNLSANWWDTDVLGIDQGPIAIMMENFRTGGGWRRFMQSPEVQRGLELAGFIPVLGVQEPSPTPPLLFSLDQNYPNPFNGMTTIRFSLPAPGHVRLRVFNALGQKVATLLDETRAAGLHTLHLDGLSLSSGVYFCRLEWRGRSLSSKLLLLK